MYRRVWWISTYTDPIDSYMLCLLTKKKERSHFCKCHSTTPCWRLHPSPERNQRVLTGHRLAAALSPWRLFQLVLSFHSLVLHSELSAYCLLKLYRLSTSKSYSFDNLVFLDISEATWPIRAMIPVNANTFRSLKVPASKMSCWKLVKTVELCDCCDASYIRYNWTACLFYSLIKQLSIYELRMWREIYNKVYNKLIIRSSNNIDWYTDR